MNAHSPCLCVLVVPATGRSIEPTTDWKVMRTPLGKDEVEVATDLYYINVEKQEALNSCGPNR